MCVVRACVLSSRFCSALSVCLSCDQRYTSTGTRALGYSIAISSTCVSTAFSSFFFPRVRAFFCNVEQPSLFWGVLLWRSTRALVAYPRPQASMAPRVRAGSWPRLGERRQKQRKKNLGFRGFFRGCPRWKAETKKKTRSVARSASGLSEPRAGHKGRRALREACGDARSALSLLPSIDRSARTFSSGFSYRRRSANILIRPLLHGGG